MPSAPTKTHIIRDWNYEGVATTYCGLVGWQDRKRSTTEFDTEIGNRFEAVSADTINIGRAVCKNCWRGGQTA